jgi:hypothetical protein
LKALGIKLLKLKYDKPLSNFAFKFDLRRYTVVLRAAVTDDRQGLTLVHFSAHRKHLLRERMGAWFSPSLLDWGTRGGEAKTA